MDVIGIHECSGIQQVIHRACLPQFQKLLEERAMKIYIPAIHAWIPCITVPAFPAVDCALILWRLLSDDFFLAEITRCWVEVLLIAIGKPPLLPAVRTVRGRGYQFFLPVEDGRDILVEREVLIRYLEASGAVNAGLLHTLQPTQPCHFLQPLQNLWLRQGRKGNKGMKGGKGT